LRAQRGVQTFIFRSARIFREKTIGLILQQAVSVARWRFSKPNLGEFGVLEVVWRFWRFSGFLGLV
jgi:hypothetical protein